MGPLDFSLPPVSLYALVAGGGLPVYLLAATRLPFTTGRNALQFLLSCLVMAVLWLCALFLWPGADTLYFGEIIVALIILAGASLFYLELWSLLSRGYTLGLLLTLLKADRPLAEDELARLYRGGEGLVWIMRHRLSGLVRAGLVKHQEDTLTLTVFPGVLVAWLYKISIATLGLRCTG